MLGLKKWDENRLGDSIDEQTPDSENINELVKSLKTKKDFASKNSGATILKSESGIKNANSILSKSNDDYMLVTNCNSSKKEFVIHLSEEVTIDTIYADNYEDFSASFQQIEFFGSSDYPPQNNKWKTIGVMHPKEGVNQYLASIDPSYAQDKQMIRYLKVILKGTDQNEMYCTLTHLQVYGKSMHLSLKESFKYVNSKNSTVSANPSQARSK